MSAKPRPGSFLGFVGLWTERERECVCVLWLMPVVVCWAEGRIEHGMVCVAVCGGEREREWRGQGLRCCGRSGGEMVGRGDGWRTSG